MEAMELSELLTRCLQDPEFQLEEGQLQGVIEKLKLAVSKPEPNTSHVQLLAELGKKEPFRETGQQFIEPLLEILKREVSADMKLQVFRGLGNLGFYHKPSKDQLLLHSGSRPIVHTLSEEVTHRNTPDNPLLRVVCLVVTNIACEHNELAIELMGDGILNPLGAIIQENKSGVIVVAAVGTLRILIECGKTCQERFMVAKIPDILVARLGEVGMQEVVDKILEFLKEVLESEELADLKLSFIRAKLGRPLSLLGKWSPVKECRYAALEMIGMFATDDRCMAVLFSDDVITSSLFEWLEAKDSNTLCSGIYIATNFARSDENCVSLMKNGMFDRIVSILTEAGDDTEGLKLAYVGWTLLRNLSVSQKCKEELSEKFLPALVPRYLLTTNESVLFKVLGMLRTLLSMNPGACHYFLTSLPELLHKLVELESHGIEHIKSESCRILAMLMKGSSANKDNLRLIWEANPHKSFTFLLSSKHDIMRNEGALALCVLTNEIPGLKEDMWEKGVDGVVWEIVSNQAEAEECMPVEFLCNVLTLVCKIGMHDVTDEQLIGLKKLAIRFKDNEQIQTIVKSATK